MLILHYSKFVNRYSIFKIFIETKVSAMKLQDFNLLLDNIIITFKSSRVNGSPNSFFTFLFLLLIL